MKQKLEDTKCFVCGRRKATMVIATIPVCEKCGKKIEKESEGDDK